MNPPWQTHNTAARSEHRSALPSSLLASGWKSHRLSMLPLLDSFRELYFCKHQFKITRRRYSSRCWHTFLGSRGLHGCMMGGSLNILSANPIEDSVPGGSLHRMTNILLRSNYSNTLQYCTCAQTPICAASPITFSCRGRSTRYFHTPRPHKPTLRLLRYTCRRWRDRKKKRMVECPRNKFCFSSHTCHH